jgi:hypothetical protein
MQKSADWMPCHDLRCGWHGAQSTSDPSPLDTPESVVSIGAGTSGAKSGNGVCAGGLLENAGETEIDGCVSRDSSVTSPILVTYQHNIPHTSLDTGGGGNVGSTDLLHLRPRELRRSSSTLALSSKSVVVVSNGGGPSPCPLAPCVPVVAGYPCR